MKSRLKFPKASERGDNGVGNFIRYISKTLVDAVAAKVLMFTGLSNSFGVNRYISLYI